MTGSHKKKSMEVFLGGACGRTTWRQDIAIPILEREKVSYHNPQMGVGEWTVDDEKGEMLTKDEAEVLMFVVSRETRGVAAVAEAAYLIGADVPTALCLQFMEAGTVIEGKTLDQYEADDLNRGRVFLKSMAEKHGVPIFDTVEKCTEYAVELVRRQRGCLKLDDVRAIIDDLECKNLAFNLEETRSGFLLWISTEEKCAYTDVDTVQHGRKWFIARELKKSEVIQTIFKAVMTWQEHEAREHFKYQGHRIFGPHFKVDELVALCQERKEKALKRS
ncbi:MAG TPA: nucleoside 2-deoxyribosyltransferase domain-containing protein [Candidatus Melainabacteria bacterium]|nr:nucleoside 2-deoxyribosyltransferase domain-containing protein [Candidatus Melainabacteria bacterium]